MPSSATKMPTMQKTKAIRIRRLKKADFETDFFFMNEVELFPSPVNPRREFQTLPKIRGMSMIILLLREFWDWPRVLSQPETQAYDLPYVPQMVRRLVCSRIVIADHEIEVGITRALKCYCRVN